MSDEDYLKTGGVNPEVQRQAETRVAKPKDEKLNVPSRRGGHGGGTDDLFLKGYGRSFGETCIYSMGLTYGCGMFTGGMYGFMVGLQKGGPTSKLRINAITNAVSSKGPMLANQGAIITMFYVNIRQLVAWGRGNDDEINSVVAGGAAGALYKSTASWNMIGRYGAASAAVFTTVDYCLRHDIL